jgi:hypothetical protein
METTDTPTADVETNPWLAESMVQSFADMIRRALPHEDVVRLAHLLLLEPADD